MKLQIRTATQLLSVQLIRHVATTHLERETLKHQKQTEETEIPPIHLPNAFLG
jgi:hypothetical protein